MVWVIWFGFSGWSGPRLAPEATGHYDESHVAAALISDVTYQIARFTATSRCSTRTELSHVARLNRCHSRETP